MKNSDVITLAKSDMLGTHTKSHLPLAKLDKNQICNEIRGSRKILEKISGYKIYGISYPYGGPASVSEEVEKIALEEGMLYGLTMIRGVNKDQLLERPLRLYRVDTNDAPGGKFPISELV